MGSSLLPKNAHQHNLLLWKPFFAIKAVNISVKKKFSRHLTGKVLEYSGSITYFPLPTFRQSFNCKIVNQLAKMICLCRFWWCLAVLSEAGRGTVKLSSCQWMAAAGRCPPQPTCRGTRCQRSPRRTSTTRQTRSGFHSSILRSPVRSLTMTRCLYPPRERRPSRGEPRENERGGSGLARPAMSGAATQTTRTPSGGASLAASLAVLAGR